jgi:hypothetical protein
LHKILNMCNGHHPHYVHLVFIHLHNGHVAQLRSATPEKTLHFCLMRGLKRGRKGHMKTIMYQYLSTWNWGSVHKTGDQIKSEEEKRVKKEEGIKLFFSPKLALPFRYRFPWLAPFLSYAFHWIKCCNNQNCYLYSWLNKIL